MDCFVASLLAMTARIDAAGLIVRPNPGPNFSAANYAAKAARWKKLWPEITVLPVETG